MGSGVFYPYEQTYVSKYKFISHGRSKIEKAGEFTYTGVRNIVNIGFGDILPDGSIDDKANSNNGDIVKALSTIIQIIKDFTGKFPDAEILFTGSTPERTKLYNRILRSYYSNFSKEFIIKAIVKENDEYAEILFEPNKDIGSLGFIIKRIS